MSWTALVMALAPVRLAIEEPTRSVPPLNAKTAVPPKPAAPKAPALSTIRMPSVSVVGPV